MRKLTFLAGFAAGYVVGARAGRERYDQIAEKAQQAWKDPRVQDKVEQAHEVVKDKAEQAQDVVMDKAGDLAEGVKDKVSSASDKGSAESAGTPPPLTPTPPPTGDAPTQTPTGRVSGYSGGPMS